MTGAGSQRLSILYLRCRIRKELERICALKAFNSLFEMHTTHNPADSPHAPADLSILYLRCASGAHVARRGIDLQHLSILYLRCPRRSGARRDSVMSWHFQFSI